MSRILRYHSTGRPADVLTLETESAPDPAVGEVRLTVLAAPVNPADINQIEGKYGKQPSLPATPGAEGVARVESAGPGGSTLSPGDLVLLPPGAGSWRESLTTAAQDLVRIPADLDILQAAMLRVNPPTALLMLTQYTDLNAGDWVLQNAANSGVGRCVIQIAKARGLHSLCVVRRPELIPELEALGADAVILDRREDMASIRERTGGAKVRLALNAVGGDSATGLAAALAPGGTLVTYGAMSKQALKVPNGFLIFKDLRVRGFWLTRWFENATVEERGPVFDELIALASAGRLTVPVENTWPLGEFAAAVDQAQREARSGKILFRMSA